MNDRRVISAEGIVIAAVEVFRPAQQPPDSGAASGSGSASSEGADGDSNSDGSGESAGSPVILWRTPPELLERGSAYPSSCASAAAVSAKLSWSVMVCMRLQTKLHVNVNII